VFQIVKFYKVKLTIDKPLVKMGMTVNQFREAMEASKGTVQA